MAEHLRSGWRYGLQFLARVHGRSAAAASERRSLQFRMAVESSLPPW
jgi:hypothetical protein